jgi:hypothetical protein
VATERDPALGFDEALIPDGNGGKRRLTRAEFEALPLSERISLIMQKTVEFRLRGQIVSSKTALRR